MNFKYVDFEKVTSHYSEYRKGVNHINEKKSEFLNDIEPIRKEMNQIISSASSGLIVDNRTQQQKSERFQQLQSEIMKKDSEFKQELKKLTDELNVSTYDYLSEIIGKWAQDNEVDVVSSKMETIFVNEKYDATENILDLLRELEQYVQISEKLEEEVQN